mmetsp:Transcript_13159/g.41512  ORF Transcript_13159/g.41512 Transcript_13159/m.41512 type:complete len:211 (-) Transcript_13159:2666-3298(-)
MTRASGRHQGRRNKCTHMMRARARASARARARVRVRVRTRACARACCSPLSAASQRLARYQATDPADAARGRPSPLLCVVCMAGLVLPHEARLADVQADALHTHALVEELEDPLPQIGPVLHLLHDLLHCRSLEVRGGVPRDGAGLARVGRLPRGGLGIRGGLPSRPPEAPDRAGVGQAEDARNGDQKSEDDQPIASREHPVGALLLLAA